MTETLPLPFTFNSCIYIVPVMIPGGLFLWCHAAVLFSCFATVYFTPCEKTKLKMSTAVLRCYAMYGLSFFNVLYYNVFFCVWSLGCWTLSPWVVHQVWLTWTRLTLTVLTPVWPSRTFHPKFPHIRSCKTWLEAISPPASPQAQHLFFTSIPLAPTLMTAWVWADPHYCTLRCLACTAAWSLCPSRWVYRPVPGLSKLRCIIKRSGDREPGEPAAGHPSTSQTGESYLGLSMTTVVEFVSQIVRVKMFL